MNYWPKSSGVINTILVGKLRLFWTQCLRVLYSVVHSKISLFRIYLNLQADWKLVKKLDFNLDEFDPFSCHFNTDSGSHWPRCVRPNTTWLEIWVNFDPKVCIECLHFRQRSDYKCLQFDRPNGKRGQQYPLVTLLRWVNIRSSINHTKIPIRRKTTLRETKTYSDISNSLAEGGRGNFIIGTLKGTHISGFQIIFT